MTVVAKPYTFSANTTISSSQMNANFDTLYNDYNGGISAANLAANAVSTAKIADDAVTAAKIADGAIVPEGLVASTGTSWAWSSWTPTYTNMANITTQYAKYIQIGKTVHFRLQFNLTGSSSVSGLIGVSLPVTANSELSDGNDFMLCSGQLSDATGFRWNPGVTYGSTSRMDIYYWDGDGHIVATSGTAPFTWTTNDLVAILGSYEAA